MTLSRTRSMRGSTGVGEGGAAGVMRAVWGPARWPAAKHTPKARGRPGSAVPRRCHRAPIGANRRHDAPHAGGVDSDGATLRPDARGAHLPPTIAVDLRSLVVAPTGIGVYTAA